MLISFISLPRRFAVYYTDIRNRGYLAKRYVLGKEFRLTPTSPFSNAAEAQAEVNAAAEADGIVAGEEHKLAQAAKDGKLETADAAAVV